VDPQPRGPDWMQITPKAGSLFHAYSQYHFVKATPLDIEIIPVSRTVGTDTIVDEMVAKFKRPDK
jgi:hypothetical protein